MIGILGGTFDPPHNGHVALAQAAREKLPVDLVVLVEESPGHRGVFADAQSRLRMARAAFVAGFFTNCASSFGMELSARTLSSFSEPIRPRCSTAGGSPMKFSGG